MKLGKKKSVILHFDLENGEHEAIPFDSEEEALDYLDSDKFPIGEWTGSYNIETVEDTEDEENYADESEDDETFYVVLDKGFYAIQEPVDIKGHTIYKDVYFPNKEEAIAYAKKNPESYYVQERFGSSPTDCYDGDFVWKRKANVDECLTSGEFQRMAPGKVVSMTTYRKSKKALGKKDKYNRLGESSYFGQNYNWYKEAPTTYVPDEYEDAYEWVFARIQDGSFWRDDGEKISCPWSSSSESLYVQEQYEAFQHADHDWNTIIDIAYGLKTGKDLGLKFCRPTKALEFYHKYNLIDVLNELGYNVSSEEMERALQASMEEKITESIARSPKEYEDKKILKEKQINGYTVKAVREDCDTVVIGIEYNGQTKWVKAVDYDINDKWVESFMLVFFSVKSVSEM